MKCLIKTSIAIAYQILTKCVPNNVLYILNKSYNLISTKPF